MSHAAPFLLAFGAALFMHGLHGEALHAQDFRVESTEPASGTVGVPLQQRIQFTFTEAITVSTDWDGVFIAEPRRTRTIGTVSLCINSGDPCNGGTEIIPRFVRFEVRHEADTDYTWFVESAETPGGTVQAEPFTLHYTTAPTIGDRQVAGTVQAAAGKHSMMPPAMARLAHAIRPALIQAERQTLGGTADGPAATRILLLRGPSLSEVLWRIDGGISRRGDGGFTIPYVRPGTYYPVAVRYTDGTATEIAALGFLDANGDTVPDTVTVEGDADVTDLSLTLFPYPLRTGRTGLEQAIEAAAAFASDQSLRLVEALDGTRTSGTAYTWRYSFYAPSTNRQTAVTVTPLAVQADTLEDFGGFLASAQPIDPARFVDTDAVLTEVLAGGGSDFLEDFPSRNQRVFLTAGTFEDSPMPEMPQWRVLLQRVNSSGVTPYERFVPAQTPATTSTSPRDAVPQDLSLHITAWPNPFQKVATLEVTLAETAPLQATVYNLLGQRMATLADGSVYPPGRHRLRWDAGEAPPGVYVVTMQAGAWREQHTLVHLR